MSSAIQQALGNLFYSLENLEAVAQQQEKKKPPMDLFSRPKANNSNSAAVAQKLDNAIGKIEMLLKEGSNG